MWDSVYILFSVKHNFGPPLLVLGLGHKKRFINILSLSLNDELIIHQLLSFRDVTHINLVFCFSSTYHYIDNFIRAICTRGEMSEGPGVI